MKLTDEVVSWVEEVSGGHIARVEQQGRWRPQFFVDVEMADGSMLPLLLRCPRDPELVADSAFLSHYDIAHEAEVLRALQGTGILVPEYFGYHAGAEVILMRRVAGTNDLSDLGEHVRRSVLREYFEHLVVLHSLDVDPSALGGTTVPSTPAELAFAKLRYMEQDYRRARPGLLPEPLLDFALWWLHDHVPPHRTDARWVQGDTGPGQFMVDDGHITALIDWELSHVGDPLLDLGVMRMRNMLYPVGDLREYIDYYAELTGAPIDRETLCFYTVLATLLSPLGMAVTIQRPDARVGSMLPRFGWDVTLRRGMCDALCEAEGVEVEAPRLPSPRPDERTDLNRFLVDHLREQCLPVAHDEFEGFLLRGALGVAESLERAARVGRALRADDVADLGAVLGERIDDRETGLVAIGDLVSRDPSARALDLLWLFSRMERRREHLWEPMMIAQDSRPFERFYPSDRVLAGPAAVAVN
jgi:aminoglycoside phosphotransferase (APT) family kinase protein